MGEGGEFRFGDLLPGPLTLDVRGKNLVGRATVDVVSGADVEVQIAAIIGGTLATHGFSNLPNGRAAIEVRRGDEPWQLLATVARDDREHCEVSYTLAPGLISWRFRFLAGASAAANDEVPVLVEGSGDLTEDGTLEITIPPRR